MQFEIKHRYTGAVLFALETGSMRLCVEAAIKSSADLRGANLRGAKNAALAIASMRITPEGSIVGWKQCAGGVIVKLRIPEAAKRSNAFGRKCRAEYAEDLGHWDAKGEALPPEHIAHTCAHGPRTEYQFGKRIVPDSWDDDFQNECSHGIHFYLTREEAIAFG